ncbi:MAG: response regulator [Casimicrobiaceae bacterium]
MALSTSPLSILVADDEPGLAEAIADLLQLDGHVVITSRDGLEACAVVPKVPFHLVLSDLSMPGMPGDELLVALRERNGPAFWFVLMSSAVEWSIKSRLHAADGYLQKPLRPHELDALVRACAAAPEIAARLRDPPGERDAA